MLPLVYPCCLLLFQISTSTPAHRPTSWAKTPRSRALSGLPLTRTTSAPSLKIIGSMVRMLAGCPRSCSESFLAFLKTELLIQRAPLWRVIGIPEMERAHSFILLELLYECHRRTGATPMGDFTACHKVHGLSHTAA